MTDELKDKFAVLTDDRPEPADPAFQVRQSIVRRRRRRGGLAVVVCAAATAAAVLAVPALGSLRSANDQPGVAGFAPPASTVVSQTPGAPQTPTVPTNKAPALAGDHHRVLPQPWSAEVFTKMPDANAYRPKAYYIAKGRISTESWAILAFSREGCLVADEGSATSFGLPYVCFDPPSNGKFWVVQGTTKEKSGIKIDATLVMGSAPIGARAVQVKAGGKTYTAPAVATPATDTLRFFALVIPKRDLKVTSVTPVDKAGKPIS